MKVKRKIQLCKLRPYKARPQAEKWDFNPQGQQELFLTASFWGVSLL